MYTEKHEPCHVTISLRKDYFCLLISPLDSAHNIYKGLYKNPLLIDILSQINPVYTLTLHLFLGYILISFLCRQYLLKQRFTRLHKALL
jgi:hypothetical protein